MIKDHMIYLVFVAHQDGPYLPERDASRLDHATTIKHIAEGQFEGMCQVLECNPVEGTCRDVTEDMAQLVADRWYLDDEPLSAWQLEFIEAHFGITAANGFRRMEAAE